MGLNGSEQRSSLRSCETRKEMRNPWVKYLGVVNVAYTIFSSGMYAIPCISSK